MRIALLPVVLFAVALAVPQLRQLDAQTRTPQPSRTPNAEVRIERLPEGLSFAFADRNRAMLGVTLGTGGRADTAGVRLEEVRADGPAAKAGLKAGDVITDINGVSLRLSAADAADPALAGTAQRRLQRAIGKAKVGDEVELRVTSGGSSRTVRVKTVSAEELDGSPMRRLASMGGERDARPAIGLSFGASGSIRDTLGLFVSSVVAKGPAESAGVVEGDRIAAVNGVDVRVPREDVEDAGAAEARITRFVREVQKGEAGSPVTLRVYSGGRYREVSFKSVKGSELPREGFTFNMRDGGTPRVFRFEGGNGTMRMDGGDMRGEMTGEMTGKLGIERESVDRALEGMRRGLQEMGRELQLRLRTGVEPRMMTVPGLRTFPRRIVTIL